MSIFLTDLDSEFCPLTKNFNCGSDPKSSAFSFHPLAFGQSADDWSSWDDAETIEDRSDIDQILVMINPAMLGIDMIRQDQLNVMR